MMDCLCDADLARVGYERPKFRAERKAPLDTLGILDGSVEDPNKRMSASERLRMEARDVWSEDELEYPEVRYAASFSGVAIDAATPAAPRPRRRRAAATPSTCRGHAIDAPRPRHRRDAVTPSPRHRHRDAVTRRSPRSATLMKWRRASSGAAPKRSGGRSSRL